MKLYKYVTGARVDILENQRIRFSQPYALNDPFETQPYYSDHQEIHPLKKLAEFGSIVREIQDTGVVPEEKVARWEEERKKPQKNILSWYVNTNFVSLSLTEDHENLLMWAHYTGNHSGFVLELDSAHPFFTDSSRYLYQVPYSSKRPEVTLREFEKLIVRQANLLKIGTPKLDEMQKLVQLFQKSQDWSYEKEWRLLAVPENALNFKKEDQQYIIHVGQDRAFDEQFESSYVALFQLPADSITAIYCGARITKSILRKLYLLIENNECYRHINMFIGAVDNQYYKLNFRKVEASDIMVVGELQYHMEVTSGKRKRHIPKWYKFSWLDRLEKERINAVIQPKV
ncbi:hypothetical protein GCM10027037_12030 [Mucilaginibacter koreensis]